jgi:hypothetical protein
MRQVAEAMHGEKETKVNSETINPAVAALLLRAQSAGSLGTLGAVTQGAIQGGAQSFTGYPSIAPSINAHSFF